MKDDKGNRKVFDVRDLVKLLDDLEVVRIQDLEPECVVVVRTQNTVYTMKVIDPERRMVRITGTGRYFKEPEEVCVLGAPIVYGGSTTMLGGMIVGCEFCVGGITTSPVKTVCLDGQQILPTVGGSN